MKHLKQSPFTFAFALLCYNSFAQQIHVTNPLNIDRQRETISIMASQLKPDLAGKSIYMKDLTSGEKLLTQWVDSNADGKMDELLFQIDITSKAIKKFEIVSGSLDNQTAKTTFSRLVPERIDDYAWENDLVAYRTYGPKAQQIVDEGKPGGTLSSGMDCWLKRVDYLVIDKWYKQNIEGKSYHKDHGEGYDPYHVNASRGCGGIGVWDKDSLYVSKNFVEYKTIASGPIRTIFELTYAPWQARGITVREKKRISLDLGNQLSRYEVTLESSAALPNCTIGLTLHDKKGQTKIESAQGWGSYWETIDDSELGTGVIVEKAYLPSFIDYRTQKKDLSQLYAVTKPKQGKVVYYAGYGWKKAGRFNTATDWNNYLDNYSKGLQNPLVVKVKK